MRVPRNVSIDLEIPGLRPSETAGGRHSQHETSGANKSKPEEFFNQSHLRMAQVCVCSAANITRGARMPRGAKGTQRHVLSRNLATRTRMYSDMTHLRAHSCCARSSKRGHTKWRHDILRSSSKNSATGVSASGFGSTTTRSACLLNMSHNDRICCFPAASETSTFFRNR